MRPELLELACCPACGGHLSLFPTESSSDDTDAGRIVCPAYSRSFDVLEQMPRPCVDDERWQTRAMLLSHKPAPRQALLDDIVLYCTGGICLIADQP